MSASFEFSRSHYQDDTKAAFQGENGDQEVLQTSLNYIVLGDRFQDAPQAYGKKNQTMGVYPFENMKSSPS